MERNALARKLRLKPDHRALILNPPEGYMTMLGALPSGVQVDHTAVGVYDFVQVFVKDISEVEKYGPPALQALKYDGLLWFAYPKRNSKIKTDINRDVGWDIVTAAGFRGIASIAIDDTWSAVRFRPATLVGR